MRYRIRLLSISFLLLITVVFILEYLWLPHPEGIDSKGFSAARVSDDIRIISKEPHSLEHPEARSEVREYLHRRLIDIGYEAYIKFEDSIGNVFATLPPLIKKADNNFTYILLMAHLDSRHAYEVNGETNFSLGAADDGYGLGTILELASNAVIYRDKWIQGVKILFTDGEEKDLNGIKNALEFNSEFFSDVGFIINLEARGMKGPALIFETSPGSDKIIDLIGSSKSAAGYSISSYVYSILPNYTDFSLIKDEFPGMNIAVLDNLDYYHTSEDKFDNISLHSIQHYGNQTEPIIKRYLTDEIYSDVSFLKNGRDLIYFSIPFFGIVSFSKITYTILNIIVLILLILSISFFLSRGMGSINGLLCKLFVVILIIVIAASTGHLSSYLLAVLNGVNYKFIALAHLKYDSLVLWISTITTIAIITLIFYRTIRKGSDNLIEFILATEVFLILSGIILIICSGENFFILLPALFSVLAKPFANVRWGWAVVTALSIVLLFTLLPFIHTLYMALYNGALSIILIFSTIVYIVLLPHIYRVTLKLVK